MQNCWYYNDRCFFPEDVNPKHAGFVYRIICLKGEYYGYIYIGSKMFTHKRTKKLSKKRSTELYKGRGKKPTKEVVSVTSDWVTYTSSSKFLKELIETVGREHFRFEILEFGESKSEVWYKEVLNIIKYGVMFTEKSFNQCMSFKIYKKQLMK